MYTLVGLAALTCVSALALPTVTTTTFQVTQCGVRGYDLATKAYFYEENPRLATKSACRSKCRSDSNCQSFVVGGGACLLYTVPVSGNLNPVDNSPYSFYDTSCSYSTTVCGTAGYDYNNPISFASSTDASTTSFAGCSAYCQTTSGCMSFAVSSSICYLYNAPAADNVNAVASSPYTFYDSGCVPETSPSPSVSSSSVSAFSSSSSTMSTTTTTSDSVSTTMTSSASSSSSSTLTSSSSLSSSSSSSSSSSFSTDSSSATSSATLTSSSLFSSSSPTPTSTSSSSSSSSIVSSSATSSSVSSSATPDSTSTSVSSSSTTPTATSSTPSATPTTTSCLNGSRFYLGVANKATNLNRGTTTIVYWSSLPGWNIGQSYSTTNPGTLFTMNDAGVPVVASDPTLQLASDNPVGAGVIFMASATQIATRNAVRNSASFVTSCTRDTTKTPNTLTCQQASSGMTRMLQCGGWVYYVATGQPASGCVEVQFTIQNEVCL